MKDFKDWGTRLRVFPDKNYLAVWANLVTTRFTLRPGDIDDLDPDFSEFYDVGINTKCNAECPFCYVSASHEGINYPNICETWEKWMATYRDFTDKSGVLHTRKPFQIAIGSTGEPTIHPDFCKFLETVYNTGVVPNYTTNGILIAKALDNNAGALKLLDYTEKYCGGVAVSFSNKDLREQAVTAVQLLLTKDINVMIHHIISDMQSVDDFIKICKGYGSDIKYHVLLPLMPSGRSSKGLEDGVFEYLDEQVTSNNIKNVAFGAHFIKHLHTAKVKVSLYREECFSKNIILTPDKVQITRSSFDLNPIKVIDLCTKKLQTKKS